MTMLFVVRCSNCSYGIISCIYLIYVSDEDRNSTNLSFSIKFTVSKRVEYRKVRFSLYENTYVIDFQYLLKCITI